MALNGLKNKKNIAYFEYDFSRHGGAVGDIALSGDDFPIGAVIDIGKIYVNTEVTSGGAATVALKVNATNDTFNAGTISDFTAGAIIDTTLNGVATNCITVTSADVGLTLTVAAAALTAGKFTVGLEYYQMI